MRIITLAPDAALGRLRPHLRSDTLVSVANLAELERALREGAVRWVVLDLMSLSGSGFDGAISAVAAAGIRIVFYSKLTGFDHARLLRAHTWIVPEVVFVETDDDWVRLATLLRCEVESVSAKVLVSVARRAKPLNGPLRSRTCGLFASMPLPDGVGEFAAGAGESSSAVRAAFAGIGLATPHDVLDVARLCRAYGDLAAGRRPLEMTAEQHGFGTGRTLERRLRALTGLTPRMLIRSGTPDEFVARLAAALAR